MEEMVYKFIDEGKREHEEIRALIREFKTSTELLFKERNNSLSELSFEVKGLSKVIDSTLISNNEVKGVTTRGGKTTTQGVQDDNTNIHTKEPPVLHYDKPVTPIEVLVESEPHETKEQVFQPSIYRHHRFLFPASLAQMPKYAKFLKGLLTNKARACTVTMNEMCSAVLLNKLPSKEKDPGSFTIPCDIGHLHINNALADLGSSISLMPYTMYEKLGLGEPKPTRMSLELADRVLIILGRPFLAIPRAMIDVFNKKITLRVGDDEVIFDVDQSIKRPPAEDDKCYDIDDLDHTINVEAQELLGNVEFDSFLLKGLEKSNDQSDLESCDSIGDKSGDDLGTPIRHIDPTNTPYSNIQKTVGTDGVKSEHLYSASANEINEKKPKLKDLPNHLEYAYLHGNKSFPIIISSKLSKKEKMLLLQVLEKQKGAIAWKMSNIKGIITGWRVCVDYRKLNDATRKDHFHLSFIDQMLESLSGNEYYCFLDGFLGFFQIPIASEDQEKTTFTYPYGTFAYMRMSFGLCNAHATFQRCMTTIFHDMVEDFMEVFMDDFLVFGHSFNCCLANLDRMLARCEETNLMLNWEKCHFMVKEGIVLGHKISRAGIEVDRAKINVIAKLPYPTNIKDVRSFLGHVGFYRRFIKDFSMISKPMTQLLMKDAKFDFSSDCKKAFNILKEKLTTAPIIISPDWNVSFELMCDASDFTIGAVLGQRIDGKFKPIYYASKTLNNAQEHYTTAEKELLAVVFSFDNKQDVKPRLIRWVMLLQGFDIEIKDKKGAENLAANHLSRLENPDLGVFTEEEIADEFPDEHLMILKV
ncbi:reverse transcriptase domain-containing protein [Tanacetum coccineum]|uniref:Reverse transcriptase domain-containing protein n=1 Tax=Tanacetum coccineum TaxID=301880 RepID=A0ABQ4ZSP4_9ASTR